MGKGRLSKHLANLSVQDEKRLQRQLLLPILRPDIFSHPRLRRLLLVLGASVHLAGIALTVSLELPKDIHPRLQPLLPHSQLAAR